MELAVNMPEQLPQVGQALRSIFSTSASDTLLSAAFTMASIRSMWCSPSESSTLPASMGPPLTKMEGMLRRMAAISMPGTILSQLPMHTMASAQWAFTMVSTESAISSRLGSE